MHFFSRSLSFCNCRAVTAPCMYDLTDIPAVNMIIGQMFWNYLQHFVTLKVCHSGTSIYFLCMSFFTGYRLQRKNDSTIFEKLKFIKVLRALTFSRSRGLFFRGGIFGGGFFLFWCRFLHLFRLQSNNLLFDRLLFWWRIWI